MAPYMTLIILIEIVYYKRPRIIYHQSIDCFLKSVFLLQDSISWKQKCIITKTCPCNVYPFIPHFYIAELGYAGVYLFFLFLLQNIDCGYTLELPCQGGSNEYPQSMFRSKNKKNIKIFQLKIFSS